MQAECGFHGQANAPDLLIQNGPTILVNIGFDPALHPGTPNAPAALVPAMQNISALVDTGATYSFIDTSIAAVLNLPKVDKANISGSAGSHVADVFLAQIHVPSLGITILGQFAGVNLIGGGQMHGALLGRSFLRDLTMTYDGQTGRVSLIKA